MFPFRASCFTRLLSTSTTLSLSRNLPCLKCLGLEHGRVREHIMAKKSQINHSNLNRFCLSMLTESFADGSSALVKSVSVRWHSGWNLLTLTVPFVWEKFKHVVLWFIFFILGNDAFNWTHQRELQKQQIETMPSATTWWASLPHSQQGKTVQWSLQI